MAWPATENFDGYTNGNNLNTLNGGSGWGGAWVVVKGTYTITTAQSSSSPNSVVMTSSLGIEEEATRLLTSNTDGDKVTFAMRSTGAANNQRFYFVSGTTYYAGLFMNHLGNIALGATTIGTWTINTWYVFVVELDYTNDRFRASINGGAFSSFVNFDAAVSSTSKISMGISQDSGVSNTYYWDSIAPVAATTATPNYLSLMGAGS